MKKAWSKPVLQVYSTEEIVANISAYARSEQGGLRCSCGPVIPWA